MDPRSVVTRLLISFVLGGVIGLERESHQRPAGLRTHILVATGSCLITLVSFYSGASVAATHGVSYDPTRIAANIITGIGFLGAGTILRDGMTVRGLTTAASLWVVSAIGLAVGFGFYGAALVAAGLAALTLILLDRIEAMFFESRRLSLSLSLEDRPGILAQLNSTLRDEGIKVTRLAADSSSGKDGVVDVSLGIRLPVGYKGFPAIIDRIRAIPGVYYVDAEHFGNFSE
ncbi:MAG: MgtC/SapB family protein [Bacillota bacterium]|jgi:putative Mg2+ transporter-C (MgtC) family protein